MKRILDSVHGYILIPKPYFEGIIDTPFFQRLRRIEQTSSRSLFPSAHHDRFIHSLGVFYIGSRIVNKLNEKADGFPEHHTTVSNSYLLACLLHDIGHSPFSHTFENFFDDKPQTKLLNLLIEQVDNDVFKEDLCRLVDRTPHEMVSAYIAYRQYKEFIQAQNGDAELVVRMIVGCPYSDVTHKSFENAFIELIHGEWIDADRLDYVCRDTWASGYSTSHIDMARLIDSICIVKDNNLYKVCFTDKALNEIESVLNVKDFQQQNVITHHTVVYEQNLLVKAMESTALHHFNLPYTEDLAERSNALRMLCNVEMFFDTITLPKHQIQLNMLMDDDFVHLMKYVKDDEYVGQWLSRTYHLKPLWKSKAEFYSFFPFLRDKFFDKKCWLYNGCKTFLSERFSIPAKDIWILIASAKGKKDFREKISMYVNGKVISYADLMGMKTSGERHINPFYFIYLPIQDDWDKYKMKVIDTIKSEMIKYIFG